MMEVVAVNWGGWKRVRRVELEHNECSDADFEMAQRLRKEVDLREACMGKRIWLDRRVMEVTITAEAVRAAREKRKGVGDAR